MGIVWFIVFFIVLYIIYSIILAVVIAHGPGAHPANYQEGLQAGIAFAQAHAHTLAVWRVLRCNPWSHGGYDPPEAQTLFKERSAAIPS